MDADPAGTRCILCDTRIAVRRTLAREEPMLVCIPCRQRPMAERKELREQAFARIGSTSVDAMLIGYRRSNLRPHATDRDSVTRRRSTARFFQKRAAEAVEHSLKARARSRVTLVRAHLLMRYLDALLSDARALQRLEA